MHSKECQQRNYLRLDCFERCNGDQHEVRRAVPTGLGLRYLAQLKGLDVHCPTAEAGSLAAPRFWGVGTGHRPAAAAPPPTWVSGRAYPPPQRA